MIEKLLIDADILVWRCCKATEKEKDPLEAAKYNVYAQIKHMIGDTMVCDYQCYLSGKDNFRYDVSKLVEYKGNRKKLPKPTYYKEIRQHLIDEFSAEVIDGMEADDKLGIEQMKHYRNIDDKEECTSMICSIDKDLMMIPGWHYNFVKKKKEFVTELEGYRNFYNQIMCGDVADNIPGLKGVGKQGAAKMLKDAKSPSEMLEIVTKAFTERVHNGKLELNGCTVNLTEEDRQIEDIIGELRTLLWIKREE